MRTAVLSDDPKLARIAVALREAFGARLVSALLFGSRARRDHRPDSDYDVAVFLADHDVTNDGRRLDELGLSIAGGQEPRIQLMAFGATGLAKRTTLMFNIRNDGVPLRGFSRTQIAAPSISPDIVRPTPEAIALMLRAEAQMGSARKISAIGIHSAAAREAYRGALFAARALIFEELLLAPHTQTETETLFIRVAIASGRIGRNHVATLDEGYKIQVDQEYEVIPTISDDRAAAYVAQADDLVAAIKFQLRPNP